MIKWRSFNKFAIFICFCKQPYYLFLVSTQSNSLVVLALQIEMGQMNNVVLFLTSTASKSSINLTFRIQTLPPELRSKGNTYISELIYLHYINLMQTVLSYFVGQFTRKNGNWHTLCPFSQLIVQVIQLTSRSTLTKKYERSYFMIMK